MGLYDIIIVHVDIIEGMLSNLHDVVVHFDLVQSDEEGLTHVCC